MTRKLLLTLLISIILTVMTFAETGDTYVFTESQLNEYNDHIISECLKTQTNIYGPVIKDYKKQIVDLNATIEKDKIDKDLLSKEVNQLNVKNKLYKTLLYWSPAIIVVSFVGGLYIGAVYVSAP